MAERKNSKAFQEKMRAQAIARDKRNRQIYSVVLFASGVLIFMFALLSFKAPIWNAIHNFLRGMFGLSVFAVGPVLIYAALMIAQDKHKRKSSIIVKLIQISVILLLFSGAVQIIGVGDFKSNVFNDGKSLKGGGFISYIFGYVLLWGFDRVGASIILILIAFVFIMLVSNITIVDFLRFTAKPFRKFGGYMKEQRELYRQDAEFLADERNKRINEEEAFMRMKQAEREIEKELKTDIESDEKYEIIASAINPPVMPDDSDNETEITDAEIISEAAELSQTDEITDNANSPQKPPTYITGDENTESGEIPPFDIETVDTGNPVNDALNNHVKEENEEALRRQQREKELNEQALKEAETKALEAFIAHQQMYSLPGIELLDPEVNKRSDDDVKQELDNNSTKLVETLKSFGVMTKIVGVVRGPSVTRYEIQPAPGVKISRITGLTDDVALNLAAAGVRMEAPIPGKSAVGVEVPNATVDTVTFRGLIDSNDFRDVDSHLGAVIGKAISGEIIICDIAKMPHLLIAGTTGSGKSVCVNSIIMSILYRATPDEVRLMMIDPKLVEFGIYSGIPHLLTPVVTDPKKAAGALKWAVTEMTRRYELFAESNVRDIGSYNEYAKNHKDGENAMESMAKIVIFIDELADLMMTAAKEVESSICRLAQLARAAGIHLVIATQRPTVNVVTGLIKANIPSRIALKVASQVDSRTIIDTAGADKLLGKGDMLYAPIGMPKPSRVQGCWVSSNEIDRVVSFIKDSFELDYDDKVAEEIERQALAVEEKEKGGDDDDFDMNDDKLEDAIEVVIDAGLASTSLLQRKLSLGYGRAARIIDIMEKMGIVGKFAGSKPREVLMTRQDWYERKMNKNE